MRALGNLKREQAAQLIAEARFELREIAEKIGVDRVTLYRWKQSPAFAARIAEIEADFAEAAKKRAISRKDYRVNTLANLQSKLLEVIEARAADPTLADIPGGPTGLVVRQAKVSGDSVVYEYAVDTGTISELRRVQEQAAKELGQLVEKHEQKMIRSLSDLSDDELAAISASLAKSEADAGGDSGGTSATEA